MGFKELQQCLIDASSPGIQPGLARLSLLCKCLNHPERSFHAVHVTGTNGKGSTSAYLSHIFEEAGYDCALYTSPHLEDISERLLLRGDPFSLAEWEQGIHAVLQAISQEPHLKRNPPTFFELLTATAFHLLREKKIPFVILEAGMGGRLDATNFLPPSAVLLSVVTSIGMDHSGFLGDSLSEIGEEKFAVVRPGRPALFSGDPSSLALQFRTCCERVKAVPHVLLEEWTPEEKSLDLHGGKFVLAGGGQTLEIQTPLLGRHQILNASLAAAASQILTEKLPGISREAIIRGIGKTRWPGRLEVVGDLPPVLLDGGHNSHAIASVVPSIREMVPAGTKIGLVYATMEDKDFSRSLSLLRELTDVIVCTEIPDNLRSMSAQALSRVAKKTGFTKVIVEVDPLQAVAEARKKVDLVLCLGSLYLVGWLRPRLR